MIYVPHSSLRSLQRSDQEEQQVNNSNGSPAEWINKYLLAASRAEKERDCNSVGCMHAEEVSAFKRRACPG